MAFPDGLLNFADSHYRTIRITLIGAILVLAALLGFFVLRPIVAELNAPPRLSINIAPSNADILIDGQHYRCGLYELAPGDYHAQISADGFNAKDLDFTVTPHGTTIITDYLVHSNEGLAYFERSVVDLATLRAIDTPEIRDFLQAYDHKAAIVAELPITGSYDANADKNAAPVSEYSFKITDGSRHADCQRVICLLISSYKANPTILKHAVSQKLQEKGYNLDDYQTIYELR